MVIIISSISKKNPPYRMWNCFRRSAAPYEQSAFSVNIFLFPHNSPLPMLATYPSGFVSLVICRREKLPICFILLCRVPPPSASDIFLRNYPLSSSTCTFSAGDLVGHPHKCILAPRCAPSPHPTVLPAGRAGGRARARARARRLALPPCRGCGACGRA